MTNQSTKLNIYMQAAVEPFDDSQISPDPHRSSFKYFTLNVSTVSSTL